MSGPAKRQSEQVPSTEFERVIPSEIVSLFNEPPLLPGEDAESYKRLLTGVSVSVEPKDVIEWLWVKDVVDLLWETQRLRRLRSAMLISSRMRALEQVLSNNQEPGADDY